jgi:hypothetical protein
MGGIKNRDAKRAAAKVFRCRGRLLGSSGRRNLITSGGDTFRIAAGQLTDGSLLAPPRPLPSS